MIDLFIRHNKLSVQTPALRAIGNIVTGNEDQTQTVVDSGALVSLSKLLKHKNKSIRREACFTISNITAGSETQITAVIETKLIPRLNNILRSSKDADVKKEAAWAISNVTSGGNAEQIQCLVEKGCLKSFCSLLKKKDNSIVSVALEGISNILHAGEEGRSCRTVRNLNEHDHLHQCSLDNSSNNSLENSDTNMSPLSSSSQSTDTSISGDESNNSLVLNLDSASSNVPVKRNIYIDHLMEAKGVSAIKKLQHHRNKIIAEKAKEIIRDFLESNLKYTF